MSSQHEEPDGDPHRPQLLAVVALKMIKSEAEGLAEAARHGLDAAEARALQDRLMSRAEDVFSDRAERLELELAASREELVRLVRLTEDRWLAAVIRDGARSIADRLTDLRLRMKSGALNMARRLPPPVKTKLSRYVWRRRQ
ncbi:hypothetical protein MLD63_06890 [Paracoccus sp. TK19116]|uniref:Uncharacterized protein n=1 Tax=Paracoccus albicereus TaxID=2922394 RepID=A0ABT1MR03_9RHOB|nr:hypothetical protein [Paracoccus albicereus]MCQ0970144.1 hypothetical protein [Paracoccus albicereus]